MQHGMMFDLVWRQNIHDNGIKIQLRTMLSFAYNFIAFLFVWKKIKF